MAIKKPSMILTFNIRRSIYDLFGISHFKHLKSIMKKQKITLLPVITNLTDDIETRAKQIAEKLPKLM